MIAIIINPIAGGARPDTARARAALASRVLERTGLPGEVFLTEARGHARELAAAAVSRAARIVFAWGGDGTVNEIATALVGTSTALGMIPAGSGNGLARELQVNRQPERAIAEALASAPRPIDAGEIGGRWFFSIAGVGFDAHIAACFDRNKSGRRGFVNYARMTARELLRYRCLPYRLIESAASTAHTAFLVTIANSPQWGNGARIAPAARVDDGRLDLVVFEETSRLATILAVPRVFTGAAERVRGITIRQIERAAIESDTPMLFHVDGEPVQGGTRLDVRVHPGVLRVAVR